MKDNLRALGDVGVTMSRESEVRANFRNMSPARPVLNRIRDTLKVATTGFYNTCTTVDKVFD